MAYLMGIDLGTTNLKVIIADSTGGVRALCSTQYEFDSPKNGYAEQDPEVWWRACCDCIRGALEKGRLCADEIRGISFSGQMHGLVTLDEKKRVVRPAILHCDTRSTEEVAFLKELLGEELIREWVRNPIYTGFLLPSLLWVRRNEPERYRNIRFVFLPKDYLRFRMTDEIDSDYSDASATLAFDIERFRWSEKILEKAGIPDELFPDCHDTVSVTGAVTGRAAEETGLKAGTPVVCGGGDQIMQGIGNGATSPAIATVNIGTSGQVCFQSDTLAVNPELNTNLFCGYKKGRWIAMGATMNAGLSLRMYRDMFEGLDYREIDRRVRTLEPGSGGLIFLPYLNGERTPHLNPNISGMLMGLNLNTDAYRIARAVMEGVAYSLMQCLEICGGIGLKPQFLVASGGGARSEPWLHILADVFDYPIRVASVAEQAGLGAVVAAGVGTGVYHSIEEGCGAVVKYREDVVMPEETNHKRYLEYYQLYKSTYAACSGVLERVTLLGKK